MPRNLFAGVLTENREEAARRLREAYSEAQVYELEENVFIVSDDTLTRSVAKAAGLARDQADIGVRGVVFKLNGSYTGYTRQSLWEWLENAEASE